MAKESTYSTATPTGTDYVRLIDDPGGTPVTANATVASLSDAMTGAVVYRIWDGMSEAINTVWQNFWAETAKAVLIIEPKASGVYTLNNTDVSCTGSAATAEKYVFGNNQEVFTDTGSLLWRGAVGASNNRVLFLDKFFFSAYSGNADSTGAGLVFQNTNWNHLDVRCKSTKVVVGTHTATGQAEFNWMRFDLQNCDSESPLTFKAYSSGDGSMRGNQIHARIFGSGIENAFRCSMNLYHSEVEIHAGGIGGTGGSPSTDPTTAGYTGANAVFWWEKDGAIDNSIHGARIKLRSEKGSGTGKVGLWFEDNGSARKQEHGHIDFATIYAQDYMAVADFADPSELPRFTFGINQQTQVNSWTADDGSWKVPVMRWDGGRYSIIDVPGVFADGATDVTSAIGTALSTGGSWYFPPGTYLISGSGVACNQTRDLDVDCAAGAEFVSDSSLSGDMFNFDTAVTSDARARLEWRGGTFDIGASPNSTSTLAYESLGTLNKTGGATQDILSVRDGFWSKVHISDYVMTSRTDAHRKDWTSFSDCSWLTAGGDTHIFVNDLGGGELVIENGVHIAARDTAIYIAVDITAAKTQILDTRIDNVAFYHCTQGVNMKANGQNFALSNLYGWNTTVLATCSAGNGTAGPSHGIIRDSRCVHAWRAVFLAVDCDGVIVDNVTAIDMGPLDDAGGTTETGWLTEFTTPFAFMLQGATRCVFRNCSIYDEGTAWDSGSGAAPKAFYFYSSSTNQALENRVENFYADGINELGGEASGGTSDIDKTKWIGIQYGESMTSYAGPDIVGANSFVDFGEVLTAQLTSDQAIDAEVYENLTGMTLPIKAGAVYEVTGLVVYDAATNDDIRLGFDTTNTESGYWSGVGPTTAVGASPEGDAKMRGILWTANGGENAFGGSGIGTISSIQILGRLTSTATGTTAMRARLVSDTSTTDATIYADGTFMALRRIA